MIWFSRSLSSKNVWMAVLLHWCADSDLCHMLIFTYARSSTFRFKTETGLLVFGIYGSNCKPFGHIRGMLTFWIMNPPVHPSLKNPCSWANPTLVCLLWNLCVLYVCMNKVNGYLKGWDFFFLFGIGCSQREGLL